MSKQKEVAVTQASLDAKVFSPNAPVPQSSLGKLPGLFEGVSKGIQGGEGTLFEMAKAYEPKPE